MSETLTHKPGQGTAGVRENLDLLPTTKAEAWVAAENRRLLAESASRSGRSIHEYVKETGEPINFDTVDINGEPIKVTLSTYHDAPFAITRIQISDESGRPSKEYSFWPKEWNMSHDVAMFVPMKIDGSWTDGTIRASDSTQNAQFASLNPHGGLMYRGEDSISDMGSEVFLEGSMILEKGAEIVVQQKAQRAASTEAA